MAQAVTFREECRPPDTSIAVLNYVSQNTTNPVLVRSLPPGAQAHFPTATQLVATTLSTPPPLMQTEEYYTHKWTVYVRGANNEDLSHVVQKARRSASPSLRRLLSPRRRPPASLTLVSAAAPLRLPR